MAFGTFTIVVDPSPRALARIVRDLGRKFRSWRPAWRAAAPFLARGLRDNLLGQGAPIGERWPELAAETQRRKARLGRNRGPLIGTGEHILDALSNKVVVEMSATRLRVGIHPHVAAYQHFGVKGRGIPARPFAHFNPGMEAAIMAAMNAHAQALIAEAEAKFAAAREGVV